MSANVKPHLETRAGGKLGNAEWGTRRRRDPERVAEKIGEYDHSLNLTSHEQRKSAPDRADGHYVCSIPIDWTFTDNPPTGSWCSVFMNT